MKAAIENLPGCIIRKKWRRIGGRWNWEKKYSGTQILLISWKNILEEVLLTGGDFVKVRHHFHFQQCLSA
jgi:hypothetical protein